MRSHNIGGFGQFSGGLHFALGSNDFGSALALGLGLFGHSALHIIGKRNIFDFNSSDLNPPWLGVAINHIFDFVIDDNRLRQKLIKLELPDNVTYSGLADL